MILHYFTLHRIIVYCKIHPVACMPTTVYIVELHVCILYLLLCHGVTVQTVSK